MAPAEPVHSPPTAQPSRRARLPAAAAATSTAASAAAAAPVQPLRCSRRSGAAPVQVHSALAVGGGRGGRAAGVTESDSWLTAGSRSKELSH